MSETPRSKIRREWRSPSGHDLAAVYDLLDTGRYKDLSIPDVEAYRAWFTGAYISYQPGDNSWHTGTMPREAFDYRVDLVAAYYAHFEVCDVGEV